MPRQAGALDEIEVTREMIEAGSAVLEREIPGAAPAGRCQAVAEDVFMAMIELLPSGAVSPAQ